MKHYTSNNNSTNGHVYTNRQNDYSYEHKDNSLLSFFVWMFTVLIVVSIIALASTITVHAQAYQDTSTYGSSVYTVPTSLCYDPLLGMSFVIYSECGTGTEEHKDKDTDTLHGVNEVVPTSDIVVTTEEIVPVNDVVIPDNDTVEPEKGNNGHGNNTDHCDSSNPSGKCPKKGTDDSAPVDDEKKNK